MIDGVVGLVEGFWTYQTPVSFLAGIGVYHLYCRGFHCGVYEKRDEDVQEGR